MTLSFHKMKKLIYLTIMILTISFVYALYEAPNPGFVPLLHTSASYVSPESGFVPLLHGEVLNFTPVTPGLSGPELLDTCGTITLFHNVNLSCQFNATSGKTNLTNLMVWAVNDSRVDLTANNDTAYVIDNASITDYNMPGCWDVNVSITDTEGTDSDSQIFKYCINDSAPVINDTCIDTHLFHNINLSCQYNASDAENDPFTFSVNDSRVSITTDGLVYDNATLSDYNMPGGWDINVTVSDTVLNSSSEFNYQINNSAPYFGESCSSVHLFHNQNLSCKFNATDDENDPITFSINDSRVDITQEGYVVDNATLSEYNMPNGWDLNITITDSLFDNSTIMVYQINDTAPQFTEIFVSLTFFNSDEVNFAANFTDFELDHAELGINCTIINATVDNSTSTYNISRQNSTEPETQQVCLLELSDTVLNSTQSVLINVTVDPDTVPVFTIMLGENMTVLYPNITLYFNQSNINLQLTNSSNNPQENMTETNPYYILNNTDTQVLDVACQMNVTFTDIFFNVSTNFTGNKTSLNESLLTILTSVQPNVTTFIFPWFDYVDYNFTNTSARNDEANMTCEMVVP